MSMFSFGNIVYDQKYGALFTSLDWIFFWFSEMKRLPEVGLPGPLSNADRGLTKDAW